MGKKTSLKKFYAYFYKTGTIRKIMAIDLEHAYSEANSQFGPSEGQYTIGHLKHGIGQPGLIPIERS